MRLLHMNFSQARVRLLSAGLVIAVAVLVSGCGNAYRPTITPISVSGPAPAPSSNVVVVSAPSPTTHGIATVIDWAGDSIMVSAPLLGVGPTTFSIDSNGATGYTINSDHTLTEFPISTSLQLKQETYTTLAPTANLVNLYSPASGLWAPDLFGNVADVFTGDPQTFLNSIPLEPTPVMMIGPGSFSTRIFAINQGNSLGGNVTGPMACNTSPTTAPNGEAEGIETTSYSISSHIPLGKCPVYAVLGSDTRRLFVLNRGSDTISVINTQNNAPDTCTGLINQAGQPVTCHPTLPLSLNAVSTTDITPPNGVVGMTAVAGPVYAEYNSALSLLVVANYDGGTISVIDVSMDEYGNDSATFGTTYTIPVGKNPASVTVLVDGSRAYTANQADKTVSIVNLSSHTVEKTLPVTGFPRTVVSTQNSTQGKVYVASPNSPYLTIIRTDQDIVDTAVLVQGNIVDVRVSTQNASGGNNNVISRIPGFGQPCNLPGAPSLASLAACQVQP
jgi:DNA-binding beta-propeller fold protein YncE